MGEYLPLFGFLLGLVNTVAALLLWLRRPGDTATQEVAELRGRVAVLEERVRHVSSSTELTELEGTVKAIQAALEGLRGDQGAMRTTLARMETFLLNQGKR